MQKYYQDNFRNNHQNNHQYRPCPASEEMRDRRDVTCQQPFSDKPLAMAYVPMQKEPDIYEDLEKGYKIGTIFPVLDLPFCGKR